MYEHALGTTTGRAHLKAGRNNQDAACVRRGAGWIVAVVCDGCGSAPRSEVGAELGARAITGVVEQQLRAGGDPADGAFWEDVKARSLSALADAVHAAKGDLLGTVRDCFLFTAIGALARGDELHLFAIGDGVYAFGADRLQLGPFENNEPPYLGYGLLKGLAAGLDTGFRVERRPFPRGSSVVLGSDGAVDLDRHIPLHAFAEDPRCFENPDMVRRRLAVLGRQGIHLPDDTTIVVIKHVGSPLISKPAPLIPSVGPQARSRGGNEGPSTPLRDARDEREARDAREERK